jgi:ribosomal subunit interface protein
MQTKISGKQVDLGDALQAHVEDRLAAMADKYFANAIEAHVVFSREGSGFRADCALHVGHGIEAQARGEALDIYASFDAAADRLEKQLRRYKRRLRDHHIRRESRGGDPIMAAQNYVLQPEPEHEEAPEEFQPVIVAEKSTEIHAMTIGDAVMRLELGEEPMVFFRNNKSDNLSVVHRRADGHIGWMDLSAITAPNT